MTYPVIDRRARRRGAMYGGLSVVLFSPLSLFASGEQGAWYDPSDLSTLWQDSARTTPVTADGDPVGAMDDKSGNGNHATQSTSAARPVYKTDGTLHWLSFDGVDDILKTTAFGLAQPTSMCVGFSPSINNGFILDGLAVNTGTLWIRNTTPVDSVRIAAGAFTLNTSNSVNFNQGNVLFGQINGSSSIVGMNGVADATGNAGVSNMDGIAIGAGGNSSLPFNGLVHSIVVVDKVFTSEDRSKLESYVDGKTGGVL